MRTTLQSALCLSLSPLLVAQQVGTNTAQEPRENHPASTPSAQIEIPKGTWIPLVLLDPISSATARKGEIIKFAVARDIVAHGTVLIRRGTPASGIITKVRKAIEDKEDGYFVFDLVGVNLQNGVLPVTEHVSSRDIDSGDGMCWGVASCALLLVGMYLIFLPIVTVKDIFYRTPRPPVSARDETKETCSPIWSVFTETTKWVDDVQPERPETAVEVDAKCPMFKDDFYRVAMAFQMR